MKSPESLLHQQQPLKLQPPVMPGLDAQQNPPNPFSGIRRAGQAKRAQNFEKWHNAAASVPNVAPNASFDGSRYQMQGGQAKTQFGALRQAKF